MLFNLKCVVFAAAVIIRSDKPLDAAVLLFGEHPIAVDYVVERSFVGAKPLNIELAVHHVLKHFSATVEILRAAFYRKILTKHEAPGTPTFSLDSYIFRAIAHPSPVFAQALG